MITVFIIVYVAIALGWFLVTAIDWLAIRTTSVNESDLEEARSLARHAIQAPIWPLPVFRLFRQLWKYATNE